MTGSSDGERQVPHARGLWPRSRAGRDRRMHPFESPDATVTGEAIESPDNYPLWLYLLAVWEYRKQLFLTTFRPYDRCKVGQRKVLGREYSEAGCVLGESETTSGLRWTFGPIRFQEIGLAFLAGCIAKRFLQAPAA